MTSGKSPRQAKFGYDSLNGSKKLETIDMKHDYLHKEGQGERSWYLQEPQKDG